MKLKQENNVTAAVEIDGKPYITSDEAILFEHIADGEAYIYVKSKDGTKEMKLKILSKDKNI